MELEIKSVKRTSARTVMVRKLLSRRRFLNVLSIKVLHMVRSTFSMENPINIQKKNQAMLLSLLTNKNIKYLKERELICSLRKPLLYKKLSQV